jgi:hypothetical protein
MRAATSLSTGTPATSAIAFTSLAVGLVMRFPSFAFSKLGEHPMSNAARQAVT